MRPFRLIPSAAAPGLLASQLELDPRPSWQYEQRRKIKKEKTTKGEQEREPVLTRASKNGRNGRRSNKEIR